MGYSDGVRCVVLILLAACEREDPAPSPPLPTPTPVPAPMPPVADWLSCRSDQDCEVFTSCCAHAHCSATGIVVSMNRAYAAFGSQLTMSFYCPMCAEGGCTKSAPQRTAICKTGTCARRDTSVDANGVSTTAVVDNAPSIRFDARAEISLTAQYRRCICGGRTAAATGADCAPLAVPTRTRCVYAKRSPRAADGAAVRTVGAFRRGFRQGRTQGSALQQGGVLVIARAGRVWHQISEGLGDNASVAQIVTALRSAA